MEIPGYKAPFSPRQAASRKYPLQFLCDLAYAVLDDEAGDLLEYRHLMKHPKYKNVWTKSFGTEIRCLATTTETIFFIKKDEIPQELRWSLPLVSPKISSRRFGPKHAMHQETKMAPNVGLRI